LLRRRRSDPSARRVVEFLVDLSRQGHANDTSTLRLVRTGAEVAVFVTRRNGTEVLIVHRSPVQGGYWHVVAGGVEAGEDPEEAARRELEEETSLIATVSEGPRVIEYCNRLTGDPAHRRNRHDPSVVAVTVSCYRCEAADDWEPVLDWEHDGYRWRPPLEAVTVLRWPETARALREMLV
jgi:dATP pyrophosphohydrolase